MLNDNLYIMCLIFFSFNGFLYKIFATTNLWDPTGITKNHPTFIFHIKYGFVYESGFEIMAKSCMFQ